MPHLFRDARDLADDVRRVFEELERDAACHGASGECVPGELRLVIPRIAERRGAEIAVPIRRIDRAP